MVASKCKHSEERGVVIVTYSCSVISLF